MGARPRIQQPRPYTVYRAYNDHGKLLYVGVTKNIHQRMNQHKTLKSVWFGQMERVEIQRYATPEEAGAIEYQAIANEKPQYNRMGGVYWDSAPDDIPWEPIPTHRYIVEIEPYEVDRGYDFRV